MPGVTPLWFTKQSGQAECRDCDWHTYGANCVGNAARHYHRTGHVVSCETSRAVIIGEVAPSERAAPLLPGTADAAGVSST